MAIGLIASDFQLLFRQGGLLSKCSNLTEQDSDIIVVKNKYLLHLSN